MEVLVDPIMTMQGKSVKIFCSVTPADSLEDVILFMRRAGDKNETCGMVIQFRTKCREHIEDGKPYVSHCKSGTFSRISKIKNYELEIKSTKQDDFTEWWCQLKVHMQEHNTIILSQPSK